MFLDIRERFVVALVLNSPSVLFSDDILLIYYTTEMHKKRLQILKNRNRVENSSTLFLS